MLLKAVFLKPLQIFPAYLLHPHVIKRLLQRASSHCSRASAPSPPPPPVSRRRRGRGPLLVGCTSRPSSPTPAGRLASFLRSAVRPSLIRSRTERGRTRAAWRRSNRAIRSRPLPQFAESPIRIRQLGAPAAQRLKEGALRSETAGSIEHK